MTGLPPVAEAKSSEVAGRPMEIRIQEIAPNPYQPRREFAAEDLQELAQSITQQGVLQPLIVAANDQPGASARYTLVAGERRLRAAKMVGLATVPCVVRQATAQQMLEWALIENIQRSDLNPIERAAAFRDYIDRFNLTAQQAAERLGQPRTTIANHLRLIELSGEIQGMIAAGAVSFGHAKVLAGAMDRPAVQLELARRVQGEGLSVRQLEGLLAVGEGSSEVKASRVGRAKPPYVVDLQDRLTAAVGTRVTVVQGKAKNAGRIVIEYYNLDDFDRIAKSLGMKDGEA